MKVGIIGAGGVGSACVMGLVLRGCAREIVIVDIDAKRAKAVATDMQYGAILSPATHVYAGTYADLSDAALVMICAGVNEKTGGATNRDDPNGRLKLLKTNVAIYRNIIPSLVAVAKDAVIMVVTDPPDPLADITRQLAGHNKVVSAGTYLDSLRFRFHLATYAGVDPAYVDAQVVGEHGTSEVFLWSSANICGQPMETMLSQPLDAAQKQIEQEVKFANITIIEGNNASQYGIGMVCARIAEVILRDEKAVFPIGSYIADYGVTLSMPSVLGKQGVERVFVPAMSVIEQQALEQSADKLKKALASL